MLTKLDLIIFKIHQGKYLIHSRLVFMSVSLLLPIAKISLPYSQRVIPQWKDLLMPCLLRGRRTVVVIRLVEVFSGVIRHLLLYHSAEVFHGKGNFKCCFLKNKYSQ